MPIEHLFVDSYEDEDGDSIATGRIADGTESVLVKGFMSDGFAEFHPELFIGSAGDNNEWLVVRAWVVEGFGGCDAVMQCARSSSILEALGYLTYYLKGRMDRRVEFSVN